MLLNKKGSEIERKKKEFETTAKLFACLIHTQMRAPSSILHIRLEGSLGLFTLRMRGDTLILGYAPGLIELTHSWPEPHILQIRGTPRETPTGNSALQWLTVLASIGPLERLVVACMHSSLSLDALQFAERAELCLSGENNTLSVDSCSLARLKLVSQQRNVLNFQRQCAITELEAELASTWVQSLRLCGVSWSSVKSRVASAVELYIEAQYQERVVDFTRDDDSTILVLTASGRRQEVFSAREQWTIAADVCSINMAPTAVTAAPRPSTPTPSGHAQCCVCMESLPDQVMMPCSHACMCGPCAARYQSAASFACPICRGPVTRVHPIKITTS